MQDVWLQGVSDIFTGDKILWYKNIGLTSKLVKRNDKLLVPWNPLVQSVTGYPDNHAQYFQPPGPKQQKVSHTAEFLAASVGAGVLGLGVSKR